MFKKILVPLDGSKIAERALKPALRLAQAEDGVVTLLSIPFLEHAFVQERGGTGFLLPHQSLALNRNKLSDYLENILETHSMKAVTLRSVIIDGDPASVIVDTAASEKVDLIVMSTHGRSGFSRWMMGSIAEKVLRAAHCPVLVVRDETPFKHILITVDGSQLAEHALRPGLKVAQLFYSDARLLKVLDLPVDVAGAVTERSRLLAGNSEKHRQEIRQQAEAYLQTLIQNYAPKEVSVGSAVIESNLTADGILRFAKDNAIDLIVLTTHGYTGLKRWTYGSVAEKLIHDAHCGLLIIRSPNHQLKA